MLCTCLLIHVHGVKIIVVANMRSYIWLTTVQYELWFTVDGGHRAVIFDRFRGIQEQTTGEGTHFLIPWVQRPIIFDIRSQPRSVPTITGSKGP